VQMLWVNLIMDTLGALALGTEAPTNFLLNRKPYKRHAPLINRPMWRNIICQASFQLVVLFVLLFRGVQLLHINPATHCLDYSVRSGDSYWNAETGARFALAPVHNSSVPFVTCASMDFFCGHDMSTDCLGEKHDNYGYNVTDFRLKDMVEFEEQCLTCNKYDYTHGTVIFNCFIFCQFFNEYSSRLLNDEWNMFAGLHGNYMFLIVSALTFGIQIFLVNLGGEFVKTTPISMYLWIITVGIGAITIPLGMLMRLIPIKEDPTTFYANPFLQQQLADAKPMTQTIANYLRSSASYLEDNGDRAGQGTGTFIRRQRSDTTSFFGGSAMPTPEKSEKTGISDLIDSHNQHHNQHHHHQHHQHHHHHHSISPIGAGSSHNHHNHNDSGSLGQSPTAGMMLPSSVVKKAISALELSD